MRTALVIAAVLLAPSTTLASESSLTLQAALERALENSQDFVVVRTGLRQAERRIDVESAAFLPTLEASLSYGAERLVPSSFIPVDSNNSTMRGEVALLGRLKTGLSYGLVLQSTFDTVDSPAGVYDRLYASNIGLTFSQPLLRNAWFSPNTAPIRVASIRRDASRYLVTASIQNVLANVEIAYWLLVLAYRELEVREAALELSQAQVEAAKLQLRHGAVSKIDVLEAETAAARDTASIQSTKKDVATAAGRLLALLQVPYEEAAPRPVDQPDKRTTALTLPECLSTAHDMRPDLAAARLDLEAETVAREVTENALWWSVDVVGDVGIGGVSGRLEDGTMAQIDPDVRGGFGEQFSNFSFPRGRIGVQVSIPIDNTLREARDDIQATQVVRQKALLTKTERIVYYDVVTAFRQLEADLDQVDATAVTVGLSLRFLEGQRTRFKNGVAISFDVLRANNAVTQARIDELRAKIRARISYARLTLALGTYLEQNGIRVESE